MKDNQPAATDTAAFTEPLTEEEYLLKHKDVFNLMKMIIILSSVSITISLAHILRFAFYGDIAVN